MKKHTIGVMLLGYSGDYVPNFLKGILDFAKGKDFNILTCQMKFPEWKYGHFDYQYVASLPLFSSKTVDAVVILTNFFISTTKKEALIEHLKTISDKPIISIGVELPFKNSFCLTSKCENTYREIFDHLINEHGCKKIAFMAANSTTSDEAKERFEAYKNMLKEYNMEFDSNLVFEGAFSIWQARDNLGKWLDNNKVNFDALISANDQMAFGAIGTLTDHGYKIPDDLIVTGYDDTSECANLSPTLSTINQNIETQGYEAIKIAYETLEGKTNKKISYFPLKPLYRQSCGCVPMTDDKTDHITSDKISVPKQISSTDKTMKQYSNFTLEQLHIYELLDLIQMSTTIDDFFKDFEAALHFIDIRRFAVCLYETPITVIKGELFSLPDKVELAVCIDRSNLKNYLRPGIFFNPYDELIPEEFLADDYSNYTIEPVFLGEKQYGYAIYSLDISRLSVSSIFYRAISSGIANSYEYTVKMNENEQLSEVSKTDELTKLLNRRGFMSTAEQALKYANSIDSKGLVFFCDMDGLKKINDGWGHDKGDESIKGIAEAIKISFRKNDVIGRLSGDEFAVIAIGTSMKHFDMLYKKVLKNCSAIAKKKGFPFNLSLSAGAVEFGENDTDLTKLLTLADKQQYIEKHRKHAERKD